MSRWFGGDELPAAVEGQIDRMIAGHSAHASMCGWFYFESCTCGGVEATPLSGKIVPTDVNPQLTPGLKGVCPTCGITEYMGRGTCMDVWHDTYVDTVRLWSCPDCAFTFDAVHTNIAGNDYSCPCCNESTLRTMIDKLFRIATELEQTHPDPYDSRYQIEQIRDRVRRMQ